MNKTVMVLAVVAVAGLVVAALTERTDHPSICFICRARKNDGNLGPVPYQRIRLDDFSRWYVKMHPDHQHDWHPLGTYHYGPFGRAERHGVGGSFYTVNPMWQITHAEQKAYLESLTPTSQRQFADLLVSNQAQAVSQVLASLKTGDILCDGCRQRIKKETATPISRSGRTNVYCSTNCIMLQMEPDR
jgi:hypothetical protein